VLPTTTSTLARVRVTAFDATGRATVDTSNGNFEINASNDTTPDVLLGAGELASAYPNPAAVGTVHVMYRIPRATVVDVSILDVAGHLVRRLTTGVVSAGAHELTWNGQDASGRSVGGGTYLVRVTSGLGVTATRRLVLIP
jgi:hypothetical protein